MSRTVKRVPLDFDWPRGKVWSGFMSGSADADAWTPTEPPSGVGWQMWETVSEGSPISPVFATAEQLASWLAETGADAGAGRTATAEQWLAMIEAGSSLGSFASFNGQLMSGVEAVSQR